MKSPYAPDAVICPKRMSTFNLLVLYTPCIARYPWRGGGMEPGSLFCPIDWGRCPVRYFTLKLNTVWLWNSSPAFSTTLGKSG